MFTSGNDLTVRTEGSGTTRIRLLPAPADSAIAMEMRPDYADIIHRLSTEIVDRGRIATTGMRNPARWPEWLIRLGTQVVRIFGVSDAYRNHRPWEAIAARTTDSVYVESHGGVIYLAAGTVQRSSTNSGAGV